MIFIKDGEADREEEDGTQHVELSVSELQIGIESDALLCARGVCRMSLLEQEEERRRCSIGCWR